MKRFRSLFLSLMAMGLSAISLHAELQSWQPGIKGRSEIPKSRVLNMTSPQAAEDAAGISTHLFGDYFSHNGRPFHRPTILKVSSTLPKTVAFQVDSVSSYGAELYVTLNGEPYARVRWTESDKKPSTLFYMPLPPGDHEVQLQEISANGKGTIGISTYYLADSPDELPKTGPVELLSPETPLQAPAPNGYAAFDPSSLSFLYSPEKNETYFVFATLPEPGTGRSELRIGALSHHTRLISKPHTFMIRDQVSGTVRTSVALASDGRIWVRVRETEGGADTLFRSYTPHSSSRLDSVKMDAEKTNLFASDRNPLLSPTVESVALTPIPEAPAPLNFIGLVSGTGAGGPNRLLIGDAEGNDLTLLPMELFSDAVKLPRPADTAFAEADALLLSGDSERALAAYRGLLSRDDLAEEFHPLILMRIAWIESERGDEDATRETLEEVLSLPFIPSHHQMNANALLAELDGNRDRSIHRTPLPDWGEAAAVLRVGENEQFGSFVEALAENRRLRRESILPPGPVEIVATGTHIRFDQTLTLNSEDSSERNPLTFRAADSQRPTLISGGVPLTQWSVESDPETLQRMSEEARGNVLRTRLEAAGVSEIGPLEFGGFSSERARIGPKGFRFATMPVPELFYDGTAQPMATWPNSGYSDARYTASDGPEPPALKDVKTDRLNRWRQETDLWLHGYWKHSWADNYEKVEKIEGQTIELAPPINRYGLGRNQWRVVNALAELDQPGEWHLESATGTIRYWPPEDFDPNKLILSARGPFIEADGCDYIQIDGLDLRYFRGNAMVFRECTNTTITRTSIQQCSGLGIWIDGGDHHLVHSVSIRNMGRGGIDIRSGDWINFIPSHSVIENCHITDLSRIDRTYTPGLIAEGFGLLIRNNYFAQIPSSAIRLEASESLIELNEFTECVTESNDQGAVELFGNPFYRGNVFRWNWFHDNRGSQPWVAAIRFDDLVCGQSVWQNLIVRSTGFERANVPPFGGVQIHAGSDNYVEENLFVDCDNGLSNTAWAHHRYLHRRENRPRFARLFEEVPWQSEAWTSRYPEVVFLDTKLSDRNFYAANRTYDLRIPFHVNEASLLRALNNPMLNSGSQPTESLEELGELLAPWQEIPLDHIGNYDAP